MNESAAARRNPQIVSLAFWLDLRGYGSQLNEASFDPVHGNAAPAIRRLRRFQKVIADHSQPTYPTLAINDGAVAYRDIRPTEPKTVWKFIERSWKLFLDATNEDKKLTGVGVRGVLASGLRSRGSVRGIEAQKTALSEIIKQLADNRITLKAALEKVKKVRRVHDVVPQLQANFAFTRAYIAEQGASKGRLEGSCFYLETRLFSDGVPQWIKAGDEINWEPSTSSLSTLATTFVKIDGIGEPPSSSESAFSTRERLLQSLSAR